MSNWKPTMAAYITGTTLISILIVIIIISITCIAFTFISRYWKCIYAVLKDNLALIIISSHSSIESEWCGSSLVCNALWHLLRAFAFRAIGHKLLYLVAGSDLIAIFAFLPFAALALRFLAGNQYAHTFWRCIKKCNESRLCQGAALSNGACRGYNSNNV